MSTNKQQIEFKKMHSIQASRENITSFLYWILSAVATGIASVILYYFIKNKQELTLASVTCNVDNRHTFFPLLSCKDIECVKFTYHESLKNDKSCSLISQYIKAQKKILATLPLTPANRAALKKTTICLVPDDKNSKYSQLYGFVKKPGEINIVLINPLNEKRLRGTLLNEIHHITVSEINGNKIAVYPSEKMFLAFPKILAFPFMKKNGEVDILLREELEHVLNQIQNEVHNFDILLKKPSLSSNEEKKLAIYLEAIDDYHPLINIATFEMTDIYVIEQSKNKLIFKMRRPNFNNNNQIFYGDIINKKANEILVHYSVAKGRSIKDLGKAFIYDFNKRFMERLYSYHSLPMREKMRIVNTFTSRDACYLLEAASDMDELLTPKMKKAFASSFVNYFDRYAESYLENEISRIIVWIKP